MAKTLKGRINSSVKGLGSLRNDSTGRKISAGTRRQQAGGAVGRENHAINSRPKTYTVGEAQRKHRRGNAASLGKKYSKAA